MGLWGIPFAILIVLAAAVLAVRSLIMRVVIHDFQRGVLFTRGKCRGALGPGIYWRLRPIHTIQMIDVRSAVTTVAGQEIPSADHVSVKVSLALRYCVSAPEVAIQRGQSYTDMLYVEAQLILRDLVSVLPIEEVLQRREQLAAQLRERLGPKASDLGLTLESVGIKDIMFPGALKQIFAQVVEARKAAQAALEKARGETATLRHLANAAKLIEGNPALLTLKTLQTAGEGKHTLVLGLSQPLIPVPSDPEVRTAKVPLPERNGPEASE